MGSVIGGRWDAGNETNPYLEYLFFLFFFFPPSPNLFQQLYQILTDFDIRFYMYELLKVSGIVYGSLDGETRNESGSSGAVLLSGYLFHMFNAESMSHNPGRSGKTSRYLACCYEVLQPNWGPLVTSKESLIL